MDVPIRQDMLFIAVATVMVNGVFQEEAYAPVSAALLTLICAIIVANGERRGELLPSPEYAFAEGVAPA
jgi:hypothetical protein